MIPDVDREQLLEALRRYDETERSGDQWLQSEAHRYAIRHEGRLYPVKRIVSLATGAPVSTFNGGREANTYVERRGLQVESLRTGGTMLRDQLADAMESYSSPDRGAFGKDDPVYQAFMSIGDSLSSLTPVESRDTVRVKASVGQGNWASVPWIALMDQRETTTTQHWIYVVYLFREDMSGVYLTFNQGVTQLFTDHGAAKARRVLAERADAARGHAELLPNRGFAMDNTEIDLRSTSSLGRRYEESTIAHKFYDLDALPSDEVLEADLDAILHAYDSYLEAAGDRGPSAHPPTGSATTGEARRVEQVLDWVRGQGFVYEPWQLATFVAAARTKPFVILAGVSGTGKSKLPQLVAHATSSMSTTIPVRPDWTDSTDLIGYRDLQGTFRPGQLLRFCRDLESSPDEFGLCVIDEMNLARVEYYFAEVLSRIEDDPRLGPSAPLVSERLDDADQAWHDVSLPSNLLIVGTVNMDESTHGFSKKVLDRAFTMELSRVALSDWEPAEIGTAEPSRWSPELWSPRARRLSELKDPSQHERTLVSSSIEALEEANALLQQAQLQVGYRVRDELALFRLHADPLRELMVDAEGDDVDPLDVALTMKLLPRISGGSNLLRQLLVQLLGWAWHGDPGIDEAKVDQAVSDWQSAGAGDVLPGARYPRTAGRLCLMWERLQSEGFTSYWL